MRNSDPLPHHHRHHRNRVEPALPSRGATGITGRRQAGGCDSGEPEESGTIGGNWDKTCQRRFGGRKKLSVRTPEAGQILHNNPVGYDASDFVCALIEYLRKEIDRVYWNVHQKHWGGGSWDFKWWEKGFEAPSDDPDIPGIRWHSYYNWGGSPDDADWDQAEADKPNFSFDGVEVRWYKYFGRSMNVSRR